MNRPLAAALLLLLLTAPHGCAALLGAPRPAAPPTTTAAAEPAAVRPTFGCADARTIAPAEPPPLTLDELRALVDADIDAEPARAMLARLGPSRVDATASATGDARIEYGQFGVAIEALATAGVTRVRRVELLDGPRAFAAPLPEGLSFDMNIEDTFRALGLPDEQRPPRFASDLNHYRQRGLGVGFDLQGCLRSVAFVVPLPPRTVRIDAIKVEPRRADSGLDGVSVRFLRTVGEVPEPGAPLWISLELIDEHGRPVPERGEPAEPLHHAGVDFASGEIRRDLHLPFANLVLSRGRHTLRGTLRARTRIDGAAIDLAVVGGTFELPLDMPALVRARLGVRSVEVEAGEYDAPAGPLPIDSTRPDLAWSVERESVRAGQAILTSFRSTSRNNTFTATWSERSAPFVAAPGDRISLCVVDVDVVGDDEIGCVARTLSDHVAAAKAGTPLQSRKVKRLLLAPPKLAPVN